MIAKIFKFLIILLFTGVSFSTQASDFYIAVSASSSSIDDAVEMQSYLPAPNAMIVATPTIGVVPGNASFDDIFGVINNPLNFEPVGFVIPLNAEANDTEAGYEITVGYQAFDNLDVEISYADLGAYSTSAVPVSGVALSPGFTTNNLSVITPELSVEQFAIRGRYRHELSNNFSLLGSAGVINTSVDAKFPLSAIAFPTLPDGQSLFANSGGSTEGTGAQLGAGVGWNLPQGFNVNLSYFRHFADTADLDSILLTLEYDL